MPAAPSYSRVTISDYLAGELISDTKHDYVDGTVFAMAGGTVRHNRIASNSLVSLGSQMKGSPCRPFNSDMKIRIRMGDHTRFYYPDLSIVCKSNDDEDPYQDQPVVIIEVLSESTRRIDQGEKKDAYLSIPSLSAYVLIEQDHLAAVVYRRGSSGFGREVYEGIDAAISLTEVGSTLALRDVYDGVS